VTGDSTASELGHPGATLRRRVTAFGLGAAVGLLVGGIGGRIVMRLIADANPSSFGKETSSEATIGAFTIGGTLNFLIQIGLVVGGLVGLAYLGIRRFLPVGLLRAPAYGMVLVVVATGLIIEFNIHDFAILPKALSVALFGLLLFVYGLLTAWLIDRFAHPVTQLRGRRGALVFAAVLVAGFALDIKALVDIA
jgi:hypothetical protein